MLVHFDPQEGRGSGGSLLEGEELGLREFSLKTVVHAVAQKGSPKFTG